MEKRGHYFSELNRGTKLVQFINKSQTRSNAFSTSVKNVADVMPLLKFLQSSSVNLISWSVVE